MRELVIRHVPGDGRSPSKVRVTCREPQGQVAAETAFTFAVSAESRRLVQWYFEEYLTFPWGEFRGRADQAEGLIGRLGEELFAAVFRTPEAAAIYGRAADDLARTRVSVEADSPEGVSLPWELLKDPARGELARLAETFCRGLPDRPPGEHADQAVSFGPSAFRVFVWP